MSSAGPLPGVAGNTLAAGPAGRSSGGEQVRWRQAEVFKGTESSENQGGGVREAG